MVPVLIKIKIRRLKLRGKYLFHWSIVVDPASSELSVQLKLYFDAPAACISHFAPISVPIIGGGGE